MSTSTFPSKRRTCKPTRPCPTILLWTSWKRRGHDLPPPHAAGRVDCRRVADFAASAHAAEAETPHVSGVSVPSAESETQSAEDSAAALAAVVATDGAACTHLPGTRGAAGVQSHGRVV